MFQLKFFPDPHHLSKVSRSLLTRLFEDYKDSLSPEAAALLTTRLTHEEFCAAWAAQFKAEDKLGAPLRNALLAIETLSLPENLPLLDEALCHLPPGYEVNRNFPPLNQALHLWIISQNTPGVTFPIRSEEEQSMAQFPLTPALSQGRGGIAVPRFAHLRPSEGQASAVATPSPRGEGRGEGELDRAVSPVATPPTETLKDPNSETPVFARLSALSRADYDHVRHAEAKRLGLRLATLDAEVDRCRNRLDETEAEKVFLVVPEPWPEPITDPPALFDAVHDRFLTYVHLPPGGAIVCTTFLGHTHGFKAFHYSPRLNILSNLENSGKSTTAKVIVSVAPKPFRVHNLRPPVVYRVIDKRQPVLVLDEIETYLPLFRELLGLLNAGNSSDACVPRCEGKTVHVYKAFAPVVLVGIGELFRTLRSRSIRIHMTPAPEGAKLTRFDPDNLAVEKILARKLARWAADNLEAIAACDPPLPRGARNRLADNWRSLFQIAHVVGGHWPARVTEAFYALNSENPALHHSSTPPLQLPPQIQHQTPKISTETLKDAAQFPLTPALSPGRGGIAPQPSEGQAPEATGSGGLPAGEPSYSVVPAPNAPMPMPAPSPQLLVADLGRIFTQTGSERLLSRDLLAHLVAIPDRPWRHLADGQLKPEQWLAGQLRPLGIRPRSLWINGKTGKGYMRKAFPSGPDQGPVTSDQ